MKNSTEISKNIAVYSSGIFTSRKKCCMALLFLALVLAGLSGWGQNKNREIVPKYDIAFYKNQDLYTYTISGNVKILDKDIRINDSKLYTTSNYYTYSYMPKDVLHSMPISKGMTFYSALNSQDEKTWLFVERNMENYDYNIFIYDYEKQTKKIIFSQNNSPDKKYAFNPFAWSKSKDVVYLEALIFGSTTENEGIWEYNIMTNQFSKLSITQSYLATPYISPDGSYFIYGASDESKGLKLLPNQIYLYDIKKKNEKLVIKTDQSLTLIGWVETGILK